MGWRKPYNNQTFPTWEQFIPNVGTFYSQHGNILFPAWELSVFSYFWLLRTNTALKRKIWFSFALHSLFRNFEDKSAKLLGLGNKNKRICFVLLSTFRNFAAAYEKRVSLCACGGIGRRARLRIWCFTTCRFESCQAHCKKVGIAQLVRVSPWHGGGRWSESNCRHKGGKRKEERGKWQEARGKKQEKWTML